MTIPTAPFRLGRRILGSPLVESLVTPNPIERYVELIDPLWSRRDVRAEVVTVRHQTARSVTLTLRPNSNWNGFRAGQHVGVTVEIDGVLTTRFYSPAGSEARRDEIELTVTAHPHGKVSRHLLSHARPGMIVGLSPPEGEFTLPAKRPRKLLLVSGGSGITPVMSMLRTLCDEGHTGAVTFIHYARGPRDRLYAKELAALAAAHLNVNVVHGVTRGAERKSRNGAAGSSAKRARPNARPASAPLRGHLSTAHLRQVCPEFESAQAYVCGPPALIAAAEAIWREAGVERRLHVESFVLPEPVVVAADATGTLRFLRSGVEIENDGRPLLAQAEAAGLKPRCGCRMGICHTCIARMESGAVRDVRTGEVKTIDGEFVQICVNAPVGDVEIEL